MRNWKSWLTFAIMVAIGLFVLYVAVFLVFIDFFIRLWLFTSLELDAYFWLRLLYRFIFSGAITLFFFAIFQFHFWIASHYLGLNPTEDVRADNKKHQRFHSLADRFIQKSTRVHTLISLTLAVVIAIPFYLRWEDTLLFFFGTRAGLVDPVYGNNVSFYLFSYPIYMLIQQELLATATVVFVLASTLYWLEHVFVPNQSKTFALGAKIHLAVLFGLVVAFLIWGLMLDRFSLLYSTAGEPIFYGPTFVDLRYKLPLIWLEIVILFAIASLLIFHGLSPRRRSRTPIIVALSAYVLTWGLEKWDWPPKLIEQFIVKPNFTKTQWDSMQFHIDATLDAYDLNNINTVDFTVKLDPTADIERWGTQKNFENIPVWDREFLIDSYRQLQGIRPYFTFPTIDEDRYFVGGHRRQVNLAAREINVSALPKEVRTWENRHLRYTHGFGAVITPAAQDAATPIDWYLRDLNMTSHVGFSVKHPEIYFGMETYDYALVPNNLPKVDFSEKHAGWEASETPPGIPMSSFFQKLLFSLHYKDEKIFLSAKISRESRLLLMRNVIERISYITPFLHLDKDPYLVVHNNRFYWIQDAYTLSNYYPAARPAADHYLDGPQEFNYIRNSVKIVVDAYSGHVDYYIVDPKDPIINAYSRAYPGLFKSIDEIPQNLLDHLRYPRDLYEIQMKIYAKYHQNRPDLFYQQADTWQFATVDGQPVLPYFMTMDFGRCDGLEEFAMVNPMTPMQRHNLSMVGVAGTVDHQKCDTSYKPGITIYKFPKAVQVNGPSQVNALINQNPEISAQFTLWNQQNSEVKKGRMIILPMGNSILYVQPIYMMTTKTRMPELARIIVSIGNQVVMDKTLREAFDHLKSQFVTANTTPTSGITATP